MEMGHNVKFRVKHINKINKFKYIGLIVQDNQRTLEDVANIIMDEIAKATGVLYNKKLL